MDPGTPSGAVAEITITAGTGPYQLGTGTPAGPLAAYFRFADVFLDGESITYEVDDTAKKEIVTGTFDLAGNTLSRDLVLFSSNANALVDWPATGQRTVRPLIAFPLCDTPPTDGQVLAWDAALKKYCPITLTDDDTGGNSGPPLCATPPTIGQIIVWSNAENAYCPADLCALVAACLVPTIPPPPAVFAVGAYSAGVGAGRAINDPFGLGLGLAVHQLVANGPLDHGLTTTGPALIVVAVTMLQTNQINSGLSGSPNPTVTTVTSPNLVFTLKDRVGASLNADFFSPADGHIEIWTANATGPLTNERILATLSGNVVNGLMAAMAFYDANLTAPWDANISLPVSAVNIHKTPTAFNRVPGVSTTSTNNVLLGVTVSGSAGIWGNSNDFGGFTGNPYLVLPLQSTDPPFSDFLMSMQIWLVAANTPLSNVTAPYGGQTFPTGTSVTSFYNGDIFGDISAGSWLTLVDAIHLYHPSPLNSPPRSPLEDIIAWQ